MTPTPHSILEAVLTRRSAARLSQPAPGRDELEYGVDLGAPGRTRRTTSVVAR